ncbi:MAG: hypothetical protein A2653_03210 [Candidatus Zambryskibacteria bacterium RIFCSPHIGHO2_01_FULL_43_25]|uniref:PsbP C-terminal domain-containing protein n=1 Tax=Candidatus Zambryskibacteria bacterium RIFCSPLOWO2_01_FULL_45_21 TaxID=1802761 RepID=A0A1G2U585_9BACT|nr:MAG: hypothetical protein A2653_03210 [Candidatus Zambryskibacteria bacterium RIFCSPHIGHO2_01_FULL_43_25]OHB00623.1 MAG: hypothetical protein A3E94_03245 [Candidatus Zambryskibacteria bacterium RIFCSPHIGHO2_12_FULL_44_12b]OHB04648.1 MAG: hypothetical protein A3B14_01605 [Candidatus Zambryskibacteria bacterium RIFCSPLOWO2_01_FULL_45_21]
MKHQKGFVPLVLITLIVIGIAVVGGGYVIYKDKQQENKLEGNTQDIQNSQFNIDTTVTQPTTQVPQKIEPSKISTTGWETYKNDEFGFEIKYPLDFKIDPKVSEKIMLLGMKNDSVKEFVFSGIINRNPQSQLLNETLQQICDKYRKAEETEGKLLECKNVTINGVEYTKVVQELKMNGGRGITLTGQSRSMFLMVTTYVPPSQVGEFSDIVGGILNTIKF